MKRILVIALGLGIALGTVSFAQDTTGSDQKMSSKKKAKKKSTKTTGDTSSTPAK